MSASPRPDPAAVWDALRNVLDPEVGENIVDLGLVYRVESRPGAVEVEMTMTTPACPAAASMATEAEEAIRGICPSAAEVRVQVVFDPPWTPERMSDQAKRRFRW